MFKDIATPLLRKELIPGYFDGMEGVFYQPMAEYMDMDAAAEFGKPFPPKVKEKLPSQLV